jgi:hypothetical protein
MVKINGVEIEGTVKEIVDLIEEMKTRNSDNKWLMYDEIENMNIEQKKEFAGKVLGQLDNKLADKSEWHHQIIKTPRNNNTKFKEFMEHITKSNKTIEQENIEKNNERVKRAYHKQEKKEKKSKAKPWIVEAYKIMQAKNITPTEALRQIVGRANAKDKKKLYDYRYWHTNKERLLEKMRQKNKIKTIRLAPQILENPDYNKLLLDALSNINKTDGKFIRAQDAYVIGVDTKLEWEKVIYKVLEKQSEIMAYLKIKKPFLLKSDNNELVLTVR